MKSILQYHFAMGHDDFLKRSNKQESRHALLSIKRHDPSPEAILERVNRIEWGWIRKELYDRDVLQRRAAHPETRLYDLYDGEKRVGFTVVAKISDDLKRRFWAAAENKNIIEIECLALYPGEEGKGRGWGFFELVMRELYRDYDIVYWAQSGSNYPTLKAYYERQGMTYLGQNEMPDFRKRILPDDRSLKIK